MAYFHGVKASEVATSVITPVSTSAGFPVIVGTAPLHLTDDTKTYVGKPVICYSWDEAKSYLGYSADWDTFTLCEAMYTEFQLYGVKPVCFINVLDPSKHKKSVSSETITFKGGEANVEAPVILDTLVVKASADGDALTVKTDYTAAYDDDGVLVITALTSGALADATSAVISYDAIDITAVGKADIIEAFNQLDTIYSLWSIVPGLVAAPGWSEQPEVAMVMASKASNINGLWRAMALTDIDTEEVTLYSAANTWKNNNSYTEKNEIVCWPCVTDGSAIYHMSSHIMGIIGKLDAANSDVPYQSPSNQSMKITGTCLKDGTEVLLSLNQANLLNSQGIVTALNFVGGWKSWGNYTGAYPSNTDVKDSFICVRRMFDWQYQTFILTYWQKVDAPLMPRLVKSIVDSEKIRLNGLVSRGFLLGADVSFLESENPTTDLLAGIMRVHISMTPPVPAQDIEEIIEYDVSNFEALFEE